MIKKEIFTEFYEKNVSSEIAEIESEYKAFTKHWDEFKNYYMCKETPPDKETENIQLAYLYAIIWSDLSVASMSKSKDDAFNLVFSSLTTTISNNLIAIIKLSIDGLDYQAMNILRNLYELGLLTLNICLDEEKRARYIESGKRENSYEVWRNYFSTKSMLETINNYSNNGRLKYFWSRELKRYYGKLSEFVHNSLVNVYAYSFTLPHNDVEPHYLNVCSHYVTRSDNILDETINLIWVLTKVFRFFMDDTNYSGYVVKLLGDDRDEYVKYAKNGCYFADYYFLRLSKKIN